MSSRGTTDPLDEIEAESASEPFAPAPVAFTRPQVVPNLVDDRRFTLAAARATGPLVLLSVGRVGPQKGFDLLLDALAQLPPALRSEVRLRLAGVGDPRALLARAAELGVGDRVAWLGPLGRDEVAAEMQRCDCLVLASSHESFGIVLAEALACGKPVVATRSGGPAEIVTDATGILVPPDDASALAAAIERMAHDARRFDPALLRASALARFGRAAVVGRLDALYQVLTPSAAPSGVPNA